VLLTGATGGCALLAAIEEVGCGKGAPAAGGPDRPRDAATEVAPMPGTVGSIKEAGDRDRSPPIAPDVRFTSPVRAVPLLATGCALAGSGVVRDRLGNTAAGL
jgi:hypothetical protein